MQNPRNPGHHSQPLFPFEDHGRDRELQEPRRHRSQGLESDRKGDAGIAGAAELTGEINVKKDGLTMFHQENLGFNRDLTWFDCKKHGGVKTGDGYFGYSLFLSV